MANLAPAGMHQASPIPADVPHCPEEENKMAKPVPAQLCHVSPTQPDAPDCQEAESEMAKPIHDDAKTWLATSLGPPAREGRIREVCCNSSIAASNLVG